MAASGGYRSWSGNPGYTSPASSSPGGTSPDSPTSSTGHNTAAASASTGAAIPDTAADAVPAANAIPDALASRIGGAELGGGEAPVEATFYAKELERELILPAICFPMR